MNRSIMSRMLIADNSKEVELSVALNQQNHPGFLAHLSPSINAMSMAAMISADCGELAAADPALIPGATPGRRQELGAHSGIHTRNPCRTKCSFVLSGNVFVHLFEVAMPAIGIMRTL